MAENNSGPAFDHLPESRCAEILGDLAKTLEEFGLPDSMHRVGALALGEYSPPALLPGLGEGHTQLAQDDFESREIARLLVKQMLDSADPGTVRLTVIDPEMTGVFSDFAALGPNLFDQIDPNQLGGFIDSLRQRITDAINSGSRFGTLTNPRQILVLAGAHGLKPEQIDQLNRIISSSIGAEWGSIVALGTDLEEHDLLFSGFPEGVNIIPDDPLSRPHVMRDCREISDKAQLGGKSPEMSEIVSEEPWSKSAKDGLEAAIGKASGAEEVVHIKFDDQTPHWLVTGATGTGKTVLIKAALTAMAHEYSPEELELLLLDFKEGVEFTSFAPRPNDESYHPHTRLVGTNVNKDPDFGISVLRHLSQEIERRAEICKQLGVPNYAEIREADPDRVLPRMVALLDEFHVLLQGDSAAEATRLLEDIGRRGRSFGIHLVMSSQSIDSITALYGKSDAVFGQFKGRVALAGGTVLDSYNTAVKDLPIYHAVVNDNLGNANNNTIASVAHASSAAVNKYKQKAYENRSPNSEPPRVFDAAVTPKLDQAKDFQKLKPSKLRPPKVLLADEISVTGGSAKIELKQQFGKNVAVVGPRTEEVNRVMHTAAVSLSMQRNPGEASFSLLCLDTNSANAVETTADTLRAQGHTVNIVSPDEAQAFLASTSESIKPGTNQQKFVFVYGAGANDDAMNRAGVSTKKEYPLADLSVEGGKIYGDKKFAAGDVIATPKDGTGEPIKAAKDAIVKTDGDKLVVSYASPSGKDALRNIMTKGPEQGVHVIVSTQTGARLTELVSGGPHGAPNAGLIGGYVAIGAQQGELSRFTPGDNLIPHKTPDGGRPNRASFYDSSAMQRPRMVVPYDGPAGLKEDAEDED